MEQYCEEGMYEIVADILKQGGVFNEILPDFINRKSSTLLVPKGILNSTSELFILAEGVLIIDWKDEFGILVKNLAIRTFLISIIGFMKLQAKQTDSKKELDRVNGK